MRPPQVPPGDRQSRLASGLLLPSDPLVVRVLPDVPAIDKTFDYLVPDDVRDQVRVGDEVRIDLHGRRVGGWVLELGVDPPSGVTLRPLAKVRGRGPGRDLLDLAVWAADRWVGRPASLLRTASPDRVVASFPPPRRPSVRPEPSHPLLARAVAGPRSVLELPPATNLVHVALAAASQGNALILAPGASAARAIADRLRRAGVAVASHPADWAAGAAGATVVGTRAAAWAPVADLACVLVLDEHDEAHQQEQAPTWNARDVAIERARRAGVPCVLTSPCPTLEALGWGDLLEVDRTRARAGWPSVEVVDRRDDDPRSGLYSDALVRLLRTDRRVLCVLNRTGRAKLLTCTACGEVASCTRCDAAVQQPDADLRCPRCGAERPPVCAHCGASRFKNARVGVTRVREELTALVGEEVGEVTAASGEVPPTRIVVGTEAVLQRVERADAVAFLDLDQELLAPRYRAVEQAFALLARAARVVAASGPAAGRAAGHLLLQTRSPDHEVVQAAVRAEPRRVRDAEAPRRELLRFPPVTALAVISGGAAPAFAASLGRPTGVDVVESDGCWLVRAPDHAVLSQALGSVTRPPGRLRIEVDPLRV